MEELIREIGWEIFRRSKRHYGLRFQRALHPSEWFIRLLDRDEWTKVKILQYTHTLPFIQKNPRKIVSLLGEYLADSRVLSAARIPAFLADRLCRIPLFKRTFAPLFAAAVLGVVEGLVARRFFAGETVQEALSVIRKLKRKGQGVTVDVLGEMALCQENTDRTIEEYLRLIGTGEADSLSVKLTNLYSEFHPAAREKTKSHVKAGLWKVLEKASEKGVSITIDMEQYLYKEITLEVFLELLEEGARSLSLAIQCYIPGETERDLERIVRWGKDHPGARAGIRLVKGANWDFDMALAMRKGRPAPLYSEKAETDLSFERNARTLLENTDSVQAAFGTHNIRSMAAVMAWARTLGVQRTAFEFQFLYGMIPQEVVSALQEMGCRVRFYVPYGDLITGLAYLVRRLLENSANGSFLRALSYRRGSVERLLTAPHVDPADSGEGRRVPACRPGRLSAATSPICRSKIRHIGEGFVRRHPPTRSLEDEDLEQLPGERNEYFYIPRGKGIVIVENPEIGREGVEEVIAAARAYGNDVLVSVGEDASQNERAVQAPDIHWVFYKGPAPCLPAGRERADVLRRLCYRDLAQQACVKKFITETAPDVFSEFVMGKAVAENTMRSGFAPDLVRRGGLAGFANVPEVELYKRKNQERMDEALRCFRHYYPQGKHYPLFIGGESRETPRLHDSVNPSRPAEVIGRVCLASTQEAEEAVQAAKEARKLWGGCPVEERTNLLRRVARRMVDERFQLASLVVKECGKNREESLKDVDEAIDFLNYYALDALRLRREEDAFLSDTRWKGWRRVPNGVMVVISPWNFPLAILTGMTSAAIVTGNTVIMKPSQESPAAASELMRFFAEEGVPKGVLNYLPGRGEEIGDYLVCHPDVDGAAFTGSREVGFHIVQLVSQAARGGRLPKAVIAEMGGKNAIIVDEDADLDEAVSGIVVSAFGYAGQKCSACSRVIVLEKIREAFERKLKAKFESMVIADAADPACLMGPLISANAKAKFERYRALAREEGLRMLAERSAAWEVKNSPGILDPAGYYVDPVIYRDVPPGSRLAQEEIFGPLLCLLYAPDFDRALRLANGTPFALTGGVYSQTPSHIEKAKRLFYTGNLYINRPIVGAVVNRQPFGGFGHSGIGSKAGGPDTLRQWVRWERAFER